MRWRPFTWFLLSIFCFVAAAYFWRLGDQWAAKKASQPHVQPTNETLPFKPASKPAALATPFHLLTQAGNLNRSSAATATNSTSASRLANRLSNTAEPLGQLVRNDSAILLQNALIDTRQPVALSIPEHLRADGDPGSYIVQSRAPLDDAFRSLLRNAGAQIVSYIPNNAYLVAASAAVAERLKADPQMQTVIPYEPYYKLPRSLLKVAVAKESLAENTPLNLVLLPGMREKTLSDLQSLQVEVINEDRSPFGPLVTIKAPGGPNILPSLAKLSGVQIIEQVRTRALANDLSRAALGVASDSITPTNYFGLTGSNVLVNVNDTGIDATHPDLNGGRIVGNSAISLLDTDGHGTHIAGIIAGTGAVSTNVSNAQGSIMPGTNSQFRGKAPEAKLFSMSFYPSTGPFLSDTFMQETAARTNAFISNNSWNYGGADAQDYDIAAASYDAAVRDALPRLPGSQPVLFVFSAGNIGGGLDNGTEGADDSILSPGTAKNVITIGATEQPRFLTNVIIKDCMTVNTNGTNVSVCTTNMEFFEATDSSDQVASFSSRGNVGVGIEGDSGRFKPDVVAPGSFVISTRSSQWDQKAYYSRHNISLYRDVTLDPNSFLQTLVFIPDNATELTITVFTNSGSPSPFPGVAIYVSKNDFATPTSFDFVGTNQLTIPQAALTPRDQLWFFSLGNSSATNLDFDAKADVTFTNADDFLFNSPEIGVFQVLSNLNESLETNATTHYYRYESGTSMSAGDASGVLALMQDFLQNRLHHLDGSGRFTNSPALMKALLINGARSLGNLYDLNSTNTINFQGWGEINLTNSLHGGLATPTATTNSMFLFDQSVSNSVATGQSHTRTIQVSQDAQSLPLRVTLVWTDPPGNPIASTKLVNDLDLIVTNLDSGDVFFGNDILPANDFNLAWDTNGPPHTDSINNVENVYLSPFLGGNYSITVVGRRVNVNALTAHPDNVAQDYALVISSGNGEITNAISLVSETSAAVNQSLVTVITNTFGPENPNNFGAILSRQHVGANTALLGTNSVPYPTDANALITIGITNQWHFYIIDNTNGADFTNAAFATFAPPNLAVPVMGAREGEEGTNSSRLEADIDLYVSRDSELTNLSPAAISAARKSVSRTGTETILMNDALQGRYYIAVKSEDQRSAEYSLVALFSNIPFDQSDPNGNVTLRGVPAPAPIPDGSPTRPGSVTILAFSTNPNLLLHRVIVTNRLTHQLMGDLFGVLRHEGDGLFAVLNNHSIDSAVTNAVFIYDDSNQRDVPRSQHSDGPGSLHDFASKHSGQQWQFVMIDNALDHVGTNLSFFIFLEKQQDLTNGITATILPGACREDFIFVPPDATNLTVRVAVLAGTGPLSFEVCPFDPSGQCKSNYITSSSSAISIDNLDVPPLGSGFYVVRLCNLGSGAVTVRILAELDIGVGVPQTRQFTLTNPVPILDDAITTITNFVTNHFEISDLEVGLLIQHPRISDLAITLISPNGTRIVLFENRGALSTNGLGSFNTATNDLGLPVFAVTNMATFYTNDFEQAPVGSYMPGAEFQDWNVLTNSVAVVRDLNDLCVDNNVLVLGDGVISNTLPTTNSTQYRLSFKVTHAPYILGMVGWWPFDDDGMDIFGGHDGLLCGDPQFVDGEVIGAFQGDGLATSMIVPRCPELDLGMQPGLTIEGWINPQNITNAAPLVEWSDATGTNAPRVGVQFWLSGGFTAGGGPGSLSVNLRDTNGVSHIIETPPMTITNATPTNAAWQHVALSYDATTFTARLYVNGQLALAQAVAAASFVPRTSGDLYFGFHAAPMVNGTVSYKGGLDEFSIYQRALCDCEIATIAGVTNRGKYGTNVLLCPVTNTVDIAGVLTTNFVNGTNWFITGPQWETNIIDFTHPLLYAGTNGPATNLASIVVRPVGCPGAALDDFILSSLVTNYFDGLMHFTDDTNIALVPIKFAPAPYSVTNFPPTLIFSNGFENAIPGIQNFGDTLIGSSNNLSVGQKNWTVAGPPIAVITNDDRTAVGSNVAVLPFGAVECELPTIPGHRYQLSYSMRGPCAAGSWNGDIDPLSPRARDLIGGNNGAFINGASNSSLLFVGSDSLFLPGMITKGAPGFPDIASKIELGDPPNLQFTNSFSIEGWVRPIAQTNSFILNQLAQGDEEATIEQIFFRGDSRSCRAPYYLALEQSDPTTFGLLFHIEGAEDTDCGVTIEAEGVVFASRWQHVAAVFESNMLFTNSNNLVVRTNQLRMYLNGQPLTNLIGHPIEFPVDGLTGRAPFRDLDPTFSPGIAIGNRSRGQASEPFRGYIDELTVYDRALTAPEIEAIAFNGRGGKFDRVVPPRLGLAKVSVQLDGVQQDVGYGDNSSWTVRNFSFTALRTNEVLSLQSLLPGSEVDTITLTEVPGELNYQPEEALSQLNGEDAFGEWRLEIWDNRVGATNNNAYLADWQLTFHLLPANPPPVVSLEHCVPYINSLPPNGIQYFMVDVPQWATMATNILGFANERFTTNPLPVTVLFNQTNFPALTNLALLGPTNIGSVLMTTDSNSIPELLAGQPYFLAVTNPNPIAVTFSLSVCFDVVTLTNCQPATNFVVGTAGIPRYFQFDLPTNPPPPGFPPLEATFWLTGANSNLTVVLSQQLPLPDLSHYDYISARPCTNDEILLVVTNSTPFPIQTNRWYVGIFNSTAINVAFTVTACYSTNYPTIIPLTNAVPYVAGFTSPYVAPPGPPRWFFFEFSVTNYVNGLLFELYNLSGDADLVLQRDVPPGQAPYFDGSFQLDKTPEQIVVRASSEIPDLRGNWLLGVYNNETTNVAYTIRATTPTTNGLLVSAMPVVATLSPLAPPHGVLIQWNSVVGETYFIRFSRTLFPPNWSIIGTVVATTTCSTFELPPGPTGFAQVLQQPPTNSVLQPSLTIQLVPPNQVRISWSTAFPGFTLQSAPSPFGPWMNSGLTVFTLGSEYVAFDTIGSAPKFYRLIR